MSQFGVLDTSVFIASETGRPLEVSLLPQEVATTVITLAELNAGVLAAGCTEIRARRLATLDAVADMVALDVDEDAARVWARLRVHLADTGRRMGSNDLWIAAIAVARGMPVITQGDDFAALQGAPGFAEIRV